MNFYYTEAIHTPVQDELQFNSVFILFFRYTWSLLQIYHRKTSHFLRSGSNHSLIACRMECSCLKDYSQALFWKHNSFGCVFVLLFWHYKCTRWKYLNETGMLSQKHVHTQPSNENSQKHTLAKTSHKPKLVQNSFFFFFWKSVTVCWLLVGSSPCFISAPSPGDPQTLQTRVKLPDVSLATKGAEQMEDGQTKKERKEKQEKSGNVFGWN